MDYARVTVKPDILAHFDQSPLVLLALSAGIVGMLVLMAAFLFYSERLKKKNQQLLLANRTKTEFLAKMSHDMRTPMNGILGITSLLRDRTDPEEIRTDLDQLERSAKYLLCLINDALDMSRMEFGKIELHPEPVSGERLFENVIDGVNILALQKGVRLTTQLPPSVPPVVADAARVEQILINIISNAIKFTPSGGSVSLKMESLSPSDETVTERYVVSDTGIGMSEDFQKHLFEPFSQECRDAANDSGTGLGLSIAKRLVDLMGGSISVQSKIDEGTTVTVELTYPRFFGELGCAAAKPDISVLRGARILLCEDHPVNAQIALRLLGQQGAAAERAENGQLGVDMFRLSQEHYYDAVLMDIRMPVMDGLTAARAIRSLEHPDAKTVPIIAMSANTYAEDIHRALEAGMNEYLAKPVNPELLYEALARQLKAEKPASAPIASAAHK